MDDNKNQIKPFRWGCTSERKSLLKTCISSSCYGISALRKVVKFSRLVVIDDCPVTLLIHYWYPEASNLSYLFFTQIIFNPHLNQHAKIEVSEVLPNHTKSSASFHTECNHKFSSLPKKAGSSSRSFKRLLFTNAYLLN